MLRTVSSKAIRAVPARVQAPCVTLAAARKAYSSMPQAEEGAEPVRPEVCLLEENDESVQIWLTFDAVSWGFRALRRLAVLNPDYCYWFMHLLPFPSLLLILINLTMYITLFNCRTTRRPPCWTLAPGEFSTQVSLRSARNRLASHTHTTNCEREYFRDWSN